MKYCIDTSSLIDLGERYYPERIPVFTPIWAHLYDGIDNGNIVSVDYVQLELEDRADDWRTNFLLRANKMFYISDVIEKEYASVVSDIESSNGFNINKARDRFMKGADPWLIALAKSMPECTVISAERKKLADYGLGAVCNALGVKHINLVEYFDINKIG